MRSKTYLEEVSKRLIIIGQRQCGTEFGWQTDFAKRLGMTLPGLHPYLTGKRIPGNTLLARLNELGVSSDLILYGETEDAELLSVKLIHIPIYDFPEGKAGKKELVVMEEAIDYVAIPKNPDTTLFGVKIHTAAMAPHILPNDVIIVSEIAKIEAGDICLLQYNNHHTIRFVHPQDKQIMLTSMDTEHYPPLTMLRSKIIKIYRVMKIIRSL